MEAKAATMPAQIEDSYGLASAGAIARVESLASVSLPGSYKAFLRASNGGKPIPDEFLIPGWSGRSSAVHRFFGIHDGPNSNLQRKIDVYQDRLPPDFIPIANDQYGNLLTLGLAGTTRGKIYFWDHEDELDDEGLSRKDMSNMYIVADDMFAFLEHLR
jgi:hypothetical protein